MITVVLPAYNEEAAVAETVTELDRQLTGAGFPEFEILVVDDGSSDGTAELARRAGATVVRHPERAGYGRSLKRGIAEAKNDTVVICDADGTYPAEDLPKLLARFDTGFDMVVGKRSRFRDSPGKSALRRILRWLVEYTTGRRVPDVNSGLRVFSKRTVEPYLPTLSNTFSFTTSLTLAYMMTGRFVGYEPIGYRKRKGESKTRIFRDSLRTLQYILQALVYYNPLKLFILFSLACVLLAGVSFLGSWLLGLLSGFLLGIGALLVALIVLCFGLLAELLRQILSK